MNKNEKKEYDLLKRLLFGFKGFFKVEELNTFVELSGRFNGKLYLEKEDFELVKKIIKDVYEEISKEECFGE